MITFTKRFFFWLIVADIAIGVIEMAAGYIFYIGGCK